MHLHALLNQRQAAGKPIRVGLIGAGKFGSMYLSQVKHTPGIHLLAVADLDPARAKAALLNVGWDAARLGATSFRDAQATGNTFVEIGLPISAESLPSLVDQNRCDRTMTGLARGTSSSSGRKNRPSTGRTPRSEKKFPLTRLP